METLRYAIEQLSKSSDIILIQEHWYFDCQFNKLGMVNDKLTGVGKAVDTGDPILPVQMPRGYGGVGALWKKTCLAQLFKIIQKYRSTHHIFLRGG